MVGSANQRRRRRKRVALWMAQKGLCFYCQEPMVLPVSVINHPQPDNMATFDHMTPRSKGGLLTYGNTVLACRRCNCDKGDLTAADYLALIAARASQAA